MEYSLGETLLIQKSRAKSATNHEEASDIAFCFFHEMCPRCPAVIISNTTIFLLYFPTFLLAHRRTKDFYTGGDSQGWIRKFSQKGRARRLGDGSPHWGKGAKPP